VHFIEKRLPTYLLFGIGLLVIQETKLESLSQPLQASTWDPIRTQRFFQTFLRQDRDLQKSVVGTTWPAREAVQAEALGDSTALAERLCQCGDGMTPVPRCLIRCWRSTETCRLGGTKHSSTRWGGREPVINQGAPTKPTFSLVNNEACLALEWAPYWSFATGMERTTSWHKQGHKNRASKLGLRYYF
jgi:hypothetical protein